MFFFLQAFPSANEIGNYFKLITDVTAGLLIIFAFVIFLYWVLLSSRRKFRLWSFRLWSGTATMEELKYRCQKTKSGKVIGELDYKDPSGNFDVNGYTVVNAPAIGVRGQIVNPFLWPLVADGAEFTIKRVATWDQAGTLVPVSPDQSEWRNAAWRVHFLGPDFQDSQSNKTQSYADTTHFSIKDVFRPIVAKPRSEKAYSIVFLCLRFILDRLDARSSDVDAKNQVLQDVLPPWEPGFYYCSLKLTMPLWFDQKTDFFIRITESDIVRLEDTSKKSYVGLSYPTIKGDYENLYTKPDLMKKLGIKKPLRNYFFGNKF